MLAIDFECDYAELAVIASDEGELIAPTLHPLVHELLWTADVKARYVFGGHGVKLCNNAIDTQAKLARCFPLPDKSMLSLCDALNIIHPPESNHRYRKDKSIYERTNWSQIASGERSINAEQRQFCLINGYASLMVARYCTRGCF